jgi:predicted lipoprotein with Yx(FWY)xxD motif
MISNARIGILAAAVCAPLAALGISACGSSGSSSQTPVAPKTASGVDATVGLEGDNSLGKVLVDGSGRTLYLFEKDSTDKSTCTAACASAWPPLRVSTKPVAGPGLQAAKLDTTPRSDGKPQVVYNGHPLYLYTGDTKAGQANGQGLNVFGARWYAVSGAGTVVTRQASNQSSGGGYSY